MRLQGTSGQEVILLPPIQNQLAPGTDQPHLHPPVEEVPMAAIRAPKEATPPKQGGRSTRTQLNRIPPGRG